MAFDALVVAFGLSRVLIELSLATAFTTYSILTIMIMLNAYLLFRFFRDRAVPKGRREEYRPDPRQPYRSQEPSSYASIRHCPPPAKQPAHLQPNSRTFLHLLLVTGKRYPHGHAKPPGPTINSQAQVHRLNEVPTATLFPLRAPYAHFL
jgi:hypothetical protein